jgi:hypothetical protein
VDYDVAKSRGCRRRYIPVVRLLANVRFASAFGVAFDVLMGNNGVGIALGHWRFDGDGDVRYESARCLKFHAGN